MTPKPPDTAVDAVLKDLRQNALLYYQHVTDISPDTKTEWAVPLEVIDNILAAKLKALMVEGRLNLLDYFDQVPSNDLMDWKGLFADTRRLLLEEAALTAQQPTGEEA